MKQVFKTSLAASRDGQLHLPWQGSWQAAVHDLTTPMDLMGACLPLFVVEEPDGFRIGLLRYQKHEHVSTARVQLDGGMLKINFEGDWDSPPQWLVHECSTHREMIRWIRGEFPVLQASAGLQFKRMLILDIHDPYDNLLQRFQDVSDFVSDCAELGLAKGTLYYLPGWSGTYDKNYPDYVAASDAGGEDALADLIQNARKHGGEVFPHLNHWALSHHCAARYPQLKQHILRDAAGKKAEWPGYLWCGVGHPLYYIDPSSDVWIELLSNRLTRLEKLGLRLAYMDQIGTPMCNQVGKPTQSNENWRQQQVIFSRRITQLHPRLIMGCESFTPDVLPYFPLVQFWGPVWSAMMEQPRLQPSSLLADAIGKSAQLVGHIGTLAPYPCRYAWTNYLSLTELGTEKAFRNCWDTHAAAGVLPTVRLISTRRQANRRILRKLFSEKLSMRSKRI